MADNSQTTPPSNWIRRQCRYCARWFMCLTADDWCGSCARLENALPRWWGVFLGGFAAGAGAVITVLAAIVRFS